MVVVKVEVVVEVVLGPNIRASMHFQRKCLFRWKATSFDLSLYIVEVKRGFYNFYLTHSPALSIHPFTVSPFKVITYYI